MTGKARRVLVYRLGSLGDTIVALPALHLVRRAFPDAEVRALTNFPVNAKAPAMAAVLGDSGLADGYFRYPLGTRSPARIWQVIREVRGWRPDLAIYLTEPRGRRAVVRDVMFLRACGAKRVVGAPHAADLQAHRPARQSGLWESEAARLGRCLAALGDAAIEAPGSWDLRLNIKERAAGAEAVAALGGRPFLVISAGGKSDVQDWGEANWRALLRQLAGATPDFGLVAVGAGDEHERCARLLAAWPGGAINLCGRISPRGAAAAMTLGAAFVGHDSGPLHLAAAAGLPCVGIYSSRAKRGVWFPAGAQHRPFYTDIDCAGCGLTACAVRGKACIAAIDPVDVAGAVGEVLAAHRVAGAA